jgi:LysM repeat protein
MNSTNPLQPQGSQFEQAASAARNRFKLAVYVSLAVCAVSLTVLLALGCKREDAAALPPTPPATDYGTPLAAAPPDTNPAPAIAGGALPAPDLTAPSNAPAAEPLPAGGSTPPPVPAPILDVAPVVTPPAAPPGLKEYVIQQGDSFYTIGKKLGVSWKAIEKANPTVAPTKMKKGDKIMVPEAAAPAAATPGAGEPVSATGAVTHKVVAGDNLSKLAKKYGVSAKDIQKANNLPTTRIKVGDKLVIPAKGTPAEPPPAVSPPVPSGPRPA